MYDPTLAGNALFLSIFSLLLPIQIFLGLHYRTSGILLATFLGLSTEFIGYVGRHLSLMRPRSYTLLFCCCDFFLTLILQVIGGAMAAMAETRPQEHISGPVISRLLFGFMCMEFAWRVHEHHQQLNQTHAEFYNSRRFKIFLCSLELTIFAGPVFRVTGLSGGFGGHLANDEVSYMILDGAMITIASLALTVMHPGIDFEQEGVVAEKRAGKGEGEVLNVAERLDIEEERDMGIGKLGA
ncbi:hypothetical protein BGZ57DRAFT_945256 [Hyaloscypha finlandica]|nr:hypothetical protein BGZ57DRAFT_945256 [Hyaloscypha finlandica]